MIFVPRCGTAGALDRPSYGNGVLRSDGSWRRLPSIARTYHAWRGEKGPGKYQDIPGFCTCATLEEVARHGYVLTPGRYVGAAAEEDDGEPFEAITAGNHFGTNCRNGCGTRKSNGTNGMCGIEPDD